MKTAERNVLRLAVVQHLRATYGIKTKNWNKSKTNKTITGNSVKTFGVALESLPHCNVLDYGDIPCFLVDACSCLLEHLDTEGLFRKSGSIVRVKALRTKLDQAEECLSTALPSDVAGLTKQFFRELPEPVLPTDLQSAFLKAQELPIAEDRTSATILLSCVLPHTNLDALRYFCSFLKRVSQRCTENKMDSSNLSVIFAPNFFHWGDGTEKVNASTEKRLKLQAVVVQCLIDNSQDLGVVPDFLMAKVPAMLGCEVRVFSPSDAAEEGSTPLEIKRCRRSLGDMVNGALTKLKSNRTPSYTPQPDRTVVSSGTPVVTPKRKLPMESGQSYGFSNKKRRSIKNFGLELFPLFGGASTPGSVHSASGTLDSSPSTSSSVGRSNISASSARRKSRRLNHRNVNRVESGKAGCFSPRVTKKEAMRKSLRLRFSLGKNNRDCNVISNSITVAKSSETIGWRLATQESVTSFNFSKDTGFSPAVLKTSTSEGTKCISKSEDNLITPHNAKKTGTSWNRGTPAGPHTYTGHSFLDTPMKAYFSNRSEPSVVISKLPTVSSIPANLCCATSADSVDSPESFSEEHTRTPSALGKMRGDFEESVTDLHAVDRAHLKDSKENTEEHVCESNIPVSSDSSVISGDSDKLEEKLADQASPKILLSDYNVTSGQFEFVPLSPLHIDSTLFEDGSGLGRNTANGPLSAKTIGGSFLDSSAYMANCSQLIDALDIQSPVAFRLNSSITVQSTPFAEKVQKEKRSTLQQGDLKEPPLVEKFSQSSSQRAVCLSSVEPCRMRVADHVQRFNLLTLSSPKTKVVRSPLKFQRTPVYQSVRRFNSMQSQRKEARSGWCGAGQGKIRAVSLKSGHFSEDQHPAHSTEICPSPNESRVLANPTIFPQKAENTSRHCALEDVTNTIALKAKGDGLLVHKVGSTDVSKAVLIKDTERFYRGSPRNPLTQTKVLSAMKPIDL